MTITNPEKECKTTPKQFSEASKITNVETADNRKGIILDSPEEFAQALIVYNDGSVKGARATQNNLMDATGNKGDGLGAILLSLAGARNAGGFIERLTQGALSELQSSGRFHRSFDYDAMGTNFFKTTVTGTKVGDKYVLELMAAYVGSKPENELAETLGRQMALVSSIAKGRLSVVDGWWFYVDLEDVLAGLPISKKQLKGLPEYIVSGGYSGGRQEITFNHEGWTFSLDIGLDADKYLRPEGGKSGSDYMEARNNKIVGGAWTTWAENKNDKIAPKVVQPAVVISVSLPWEGYLRPIAVTEDQMKAVQSARNYLADLIRVK
jgi:hypothetical protein